MTATYTCARLQIAIEGLSKILCMEQRKNVAKKRRRRDHVTHHVTHVIDDGGANGGTRKSHVHVHAKTIKSPVLPYNKWEAQPNKGSARSESPIAMSDTVDPRLGSSYVVSDGTVHHTMQTAFSSNGVFEAEVILTGGLFLLSYSVFILCFLIFPFLGRALD